MKKFHVLLPASVASLYKRITAGYLKTLSKYELSDAPKEKRNNPS